MREVDLQTWKRKDIFNLYYQYDIPQISLCTPLNVSKVYNFAKKKGLSFYYCLCYVFCTAFLKNEEFLMRMLKGKLVVEDGEYVNICAYKEGDEIFKIITGKYYNDIEKFCKETQKALQNQTTFTEPLPEGVRRSQVIAYISCTPWFEFTHMTHPQDVQRNSFTPHVTFDKMKTNEKGERWLNVSLQVNHCVIDGSLIAKLLEDVNSIINQM